jgi:transposase
VFKPGGPQRTRPLDAWPAWACRSKLAPFVELARALRARRTEIAHTLAYKLTNARTESTNQKIRLLIRRAHGFRSIDTLTAIIRLCLAGYARPLPGRE